MTVGRPEIDLVVFLFPPHQFFPPYNKTNDSVLFELRKNLHEALKLDPNIKVFPLVSPGCYVGNATTSPSFCICKNDPDHRCCEEFVQVEVGGKETAETVLFRIFLAPSLGDKPDSQRQAAYRKVQKLHVEGKVSLEEVGAGWGPAFIESSSEAMAHAHKLTLSFIRLCSFWVQLNEIKSLQRYAVETVAFLISKRSATRFTTVDERNGIAGSSSTTVELNLLDAFRQFLSYCVELRSVRHLCEIEPPATFVSRIKDAPMDKPYLLDNFNPYCNLLESVSAWGGKIGCCCALLRVADVHD